MSAEKIFNCESLDLFIDIIESVIQTRSYSGSKFYICNINSNKFLTKLGFYKKPAPELYGGKGVGTTPQAEAEILILKYLNKYIVDKNISPCILEMIHYNICSTEKFMPSTGFCDKLKVDYRAISPADDLYDTLCKYGELVKAGLAHPKCSFVVLDICNISFDIYLQKAMNTPISLYIFKSLLFQIIFTLYAIDVIFPGFKHNDLHTDNIMLKFDLQTPMNDPRYVQYKIVTGKTETVFNIPYFNLIPKIIDFGFSIMPSEGIISDIVEDRTMMFHRSGSTDALTLFHWIYHTVAISNKDNVSKINGMLSALEPSECYISSNYAREARRVKLNSYAKMIRSDVFREYSRKTIPESLVMHRYELDLTE